jgi:hypothetical protein
VHIVGFTILIYKMHSQQDIKLVNSLMFMILFCILQKLQYQECLLPYKISKSYGPKQYLRIYVIIHRKHRAPLSQIQIELSVAGEYNDICSDTQDS